MNPVVEELQEQIRDLQPEERQSLFLHLLVDKTIAFQEIVSAYVSFLEHCQQENNSVVADLAISLVGLMDKDMEGAYSPEKALQVLIRSGRFQGMPAYEEKLKKKLEEIKLINNEFERVCQDKEKAVAEGDFVKATSLRKRGEQLKRKKSLNG